MPYPPLSMLQVLQRRAPQQHLRIHRCSDPKLWYAHLVGQLWPWDGGIWPGDGYAVREPAGYSNLIRFTDATPEPIQTTTMPEATSTTILAEVIGLTIRSQHSSRDNHIELESIRPPGELIKISGIQGKLIAAMGPSLGKTVEVTLKPVDLHPQAASTQTSRDESHHHHRSALRPVAQALHVAAAAVLPPAPDRAQPRQAAPHHPPRRPLPHRPTPCAMTTPLPPAVRQLLEALADPTSSLLRPVHAHKDAESRAKAARRITTRAAELLREHTTKEAMHG